MMKNRTSSKAAHRHCQKGSSYIEYLIAAGCMAAAAYWLYSNNYQGMADTLSNQQDQRMQQLRGIGRN